MGSEAEVMGATRQGEDEGQAERLKSGSIQRAVACCGIAAVAAYALCGVELWFGISSRTCGKIWERYLPF